MLHEIFRRAEDTYNLGGQRFQEEVIDINCYKTVTWRANLTRASAPSQSKSQEKVVPERKVTSGKV